jgi:hypothetical protein
LEFCHPELVEGSVSPSFQLENEASFNLAALRRQSSLSSMDLEPSDVIAAMGVICVLVSAIIGVTGVVIGAYIAGYYSDRATKSLLQGQKDAQQEERALKVKAVLSALYHELDSVWRLYMQGMGQEIEKVPPADKPQGFLIVYPIISDYFPLYQANAANIGLIQDTELRNKLVHTYTLAKSLVDSYKMNNQLIKELFELHLQYYKASGINIAVVTECKKLRDHAEFVLNNYGSKLRVLHFQCKEKAEELLKLLEKQ